MIPKIVFRYSTAYNEIIRKSRSLDISEYPTEEEINNYIRDVRVLWEKESEKILTKISEIMGLEWNWNKINCYVVAKGIANFTFPLTVTMWEEKTDFIDVLTHELIHRLEYQHQLRREKWLKYLDDNYKEEKFKTKSHLLLFAVHKKIYLELFSKERLKKNLKRNEDMPDYMKAWKIIEQEDHENIIKKFREITK